MEDAQNVHSSSNAVNTAFNVPGLGRMEKIYCRCGRIIGLDSIQMRTKRQLGKEMECTQCRNARISREIDEMNAIFGSEAAETD